MDRVSSNVKAYRRSGLRKLEDEQFFDARFEDLGKTSWDEYQAARDREDTPATGRPGSAADSKKGR
jgi:hypothetical protein